MNVSPFEIVLIIVNVLFLWLIFGTNIRANRVVDETKDLQQQAQEWAKITGKCNDNNMTLYRAVSIDEATMAEVAKILNDFQHKLQVHETLLTIHSEALKLKLLTAPIIETESVLEVTAGLEAENSGA